MVWKRQGSSEKGAAINTGCGWKRDDKFTPPYDIALSNGKENSVRFLELNGDGSVDIVGLFNDKIESQIGKRLLVKRIIFLKVKRSQTSSLLQERITVKENNLLPSFLDFSDKMAATCALMCVSSIHNGL